MKKLTIAVAAAFICGAALADPTCPTGGEACTISQQTIGDTSNDNSSSTSHSTQLNPSSNSNASGVSTNADQRLQQSGNTVDQHGSTQSATGGNSSAVGNLDTSSHTSTSSASNGPQSMGAVGTSSSGGNKLSNDGSGNSSNTLGQGQTANGGSASQGIKDAGNSSNDNANTNSLAQGIKDAGNSSNDNKNKQGQGQGQGQAQGIKDAGNSANLNSTKTGTKTSTSTGQGQGQGQGMQNGIGIDTSDHSVHQSTSNVDARTFVAPTLPSIPGSAAYPVQGSSIITACGPLRAVVTRQVSAYYHGLTHTTTDFLTETDRLAPVYDESGNRVKYWARTMPDGSTELTGSRIIMRYSVLNAAGSRGFGLAGNGNGFAGGQGNMASSAAYTVDIQHYEEIPCTINVAAPKAETKVVPVIPTINKIKE